jgi:tRNA dimethylallyltransferase
MKPLIDPARAAMFFVHPERGALVARIEARFDAMIAAGALDEVRALDARALDERLPAMKAHGVPWLRRHLRGEISIAEAAEGAKMDTRRYAKRQVTWFRNQMPGWTWVKPEEARGAVERAVGPA